MAVPQWFSATAYYENKLASLGGDWTATKLDAALREAGYGTSDEGLYRHFVEYGNDEGVSPNAYFSTKQYLYNKAADFYNVESPSTIQISQVNWLIKEAGMTPWEHFNLYGWREGINPSDKFDVGKYLDDKLADLGSGWTMDGLVDALLKGGLSPVTHYMEYGKNEGLEPKAPGESTPEVATRLVIELMDVKNAELNGHPLTENAFSGYKFSYQASEGGETVAITLDLTSDGGTLYSGPAATYQTLRQAFEKALDNVGYGDDFTVTLGSAYTATGSSMGNVYSAVGTQIVITPVSGTVSLGASSGFMSGGGIVHPNALIVYSSKVEESPSTTAAFALVASWDEGLLDGSVLSDAEHDGDAAAVDVIGADVIPEILGA